MVNIQKSGDSAIKFTFTDNDRYLYDGEITVPLNSLILVFDESNMAVFKKIDGDVFLTFLIGNSNFSSKSDLETFYKENMVGSTGGGGVDSGTVQTMIDSSISGLAESSAVTEEISEAVSGKADTSAVTQSINAAVSGKADSSVVTSLNGVVTGHTADTTIHVTSNDKEKWNKVDDKLDASAYTPTDLSQYWTSAETENAITSAVSGKADTSAVTSLSSDVQTLSGQVQTNEATLTAHTANTDIHVTASDKQNWNNKSDFSGSYNDLTDKPTIPTVPTNVSAFNNDAGYATSGYVDSSVSGKADTSAVTASIAEAVSGKQDTLIAGTNITISGNVISAEGSSITVDQTIDRNSENPISNKAISNKATDGDGGVSNTGGRYKWDFYSVGGVGTNKGFYLDIINGEPVIRKYNNTRNLNLVETSAITSSVTSASTDSQVPSAKAVYDALGGGGGSSYTAGDGIDITSDVISVTGKVDTSAITSSVTSASTDSEIPSAKAVYDALGGGGGSSYTAGDGIDITSDVISVTGKVDTSAITSSVTSASTDSQVPSAKAVYDALDDKADSTAVTSLSSDVQTLSGQVETDEKVTATALVDLDNRKLDASAYTPTDLSNYYTKSQTSGATQISTALDDKADTSAITTSVTSASTDSQVPSAKAVYDQLGGLKLVQISQSDYDALATKDSSTLYIITNVVN